MDEPECKPKPLHISTPYLIFLFSSATVPLLHVMMQLVLNLMTDVTILLTALMAVMKMIVNHWILMKMDTTNYFPQPQMLRKQN